MSFRLACACLLDVAKAGAALARISFQFENPKPGNRQIV